MSNMSYCRFQNTLTDLRDCYEALMNDDFENEEYEEGWARRRLIELCGKIHREFAQDEDE